jgi:hypothetical protein
MPRKIFISYRREDVPGDARGIRDALGAKFGHGNVFMDVDNLLAGQRFDRELGKALDACDVLIAVIGRHWTDLLHAKTTSRERDYVRDEIATALKRGVVVVPVRVGQEGRMPPLPRQDELPEDIRDLVLYQKHDVAHERFGRDLADLTAAIQTVRRGERRHVAWGMLTAVASLVVISLSGAIILYQAGTFGRTAGKQEVEGGNTPARGGEPLVSADSPSASADGCKAEVITVTGRTKGLIKTWTKQKELEGKGDALDIAVATWEREVNGKFGENWKQWSRAKDKSFECAPAKGQVVMGVACSVSGRPCESDTATTASPK